MELWNLTEKFNYWLWWQSETCNLTVVSLLFLFTDWEFWEIPPVQVLKKFLTVAIGAGWYWHWCLYCVDARVQLAGRLGSVGIVRSNSTTGHCETTNRCSGIESQMLSLSCRMMVVPVHSMDAHDPFSHPHPKKVLGRIREDTISIGRKSCCTMVVVVVVPADGCILTVVLRPISRDATRDGMPLIHSTIVVLFLLVSCGLVVEPVDGNCCDKMDIIFRFLRVVTVCAFRYSGSCSLLEGGFVFLLRAGTTGVSTFLESRDRDDVFLESHFFCFHPFWQEDSFTTAHSYNNSYCIVQSWLVEVFLWPWNAVKRRCWVLFLRMIGRKWQSNHGSVRRNLTLHRPFVLIRMRQVQERTLFKLFDRLHHQRRNQ